MENPILALARRHFPGFEKFRVTCAIAVIAAVIVCRFVPNPGVPVVLGAILLLLHMGLSFEVTSAATKLLAESRQTGLLELLLTTPLREDEIAAGHLLALKRGATREIGRAHV